jgi:hypothetical protein
MPFPHGHALIIGVGTYQHELRLNVPTTAADAQAVAEVLRDPRFCGYPAEQVTLLTDGQATRAAILAALDHLPHTKPTDTLLLFSSGHGHYSADGTYHLTTHDTRLDGGKVVASTAISQAELLERLRATPAERVLLLFNACHAGEVSPVLGEGDAPFTGATLPPQTADALLSTGSGRIIITACRERQVSFIGPGPLTLFAQALTDGLRGQGFNGRAGFISAYDLYTHLFFAIGEAVERHISPALRQWYGETQEPELTVLKGVGPFAVALYRGATDLGDFPADHTPAEGTAVRQVNPARSQWALQQAIQQTVSGTGAVGVVGDVSHSPITTGSGHTVIQSGRDTVHAGRDVTQVGGDYVGGDRIDAQGAQGFVNRPTGSVSQQFGDTVGGDKISGNITATGISGTGVSIGHQGRVQVQQGGGQAASVNPFARVYEAITARPADPDVDRDEMTRTVQDIEQEARKGDQASEKRLTRWLHSLAAMAEDIFALTVAALTDPQAAGMTVARRVAEQTRQEQ